MGRQIRPEIKKPKPRQKIPTIPQTGTAPFDSEEHFKDYDHDAVMELSKKTVICPATFNRKGTVEQCLSVTNAHKLGAKMYIHDDGSDEYDEAWLGQFCDRVFRHPRSAGGKKGVKNLRSNIAKSLLGAYEPETFSRWLNQDFGPEGPEFLYMVDSDGMHDPYFFYRIHEMMQLSPNWGAISLYSAKFHSPRNQRIEKSPIDKHTVLRNVGPGISLFFRVQSFRDKPKQVQVPDRRGWDGYYCQQIAARRIITSLVSYVEHYGKWGFHNKGSFDRDRALNPTKFLVDRRAETIKQIEAEYKKTQKTLAESREQKRKR